MPNNRPHADVQTYVVFVVSLRYTLSQKLLRFGAGEPGVSRKWNRAMEQIYTSKIDTWLGAILIGAMGVCVYAFFVALRTGSIGAILSCLPALILGAGLPLWLMMSTRYILSDTTLLVQSGPFKWKVLVNEVISITPTSNPLSSPALSLDRLRIEYGTRKAIMISPKLKSQFIQDLEARRDNPANKKFKTNAYGAV